MAISNGGVLSAFEFGHTASSFTATVDNNSSISLLKCCRKNFNSDGAHFMYTRYNSANN